MSAKTSPCARPTSSHRPMSVTNMRVRTTSSSRAPTMLKRELGAAQRLARLLPDVVAPDRAAALRCCCRAGDRHPLADAHRP